MVGVLLKSPKRGTIARWTAASALAFIVGCGGTSAARLQATNCKKSPVVTGGNSGAGAGNSLTSHQPDSLNLASNLPTISGDPGIGTGYLDISTKTAAGVADSRRCTMHLRPVDSSNATVRIWTAGHCFFDPQTDKFQNSKYTLRIYYKGGYFSANATLEGIEELAQFSKGVLTAISGSGLSGISGVVTGQLLQALPSGTGQNCLDDEKLFVGKLSNKKQVACFARSEMRGFKAGLNMDAASSGYLAEVLKVLRTREAAALAKLDSKSSNLMRYYSEAHYAERRRVADLRSLAYMLNKKICTVYAANGSDPKAQDLYDPVRKEYDSVQLCAPTPFPGLTVRDIVIAQLSDPAILPKADNDLMKKYYNDTTSDLQTLRQQTIGCNSIDVNNLSLPIEKMTPCDFGVLSTELWKLWVDSGTQTVASGALNDANLFGFNPDSYLSIATNAAQTAAQKASGARGKARLLPLNSQTVLNFGNWMSRKDNNTLLINADPTAQGLFLSKGDSGSMLSIFGYYPMGLLSTVDGERTSGGASVTPLPNVGSEEETSTLPSSNAGC